MGTAFVRLVELLSLEPDARGVHAGRLVRVTAVRKSTLAKQAVSHELLFGRVKLILTFPSKHSACLLGVNGHAGGYIFACVSG